jgi:hypothetical protein
VQALEDDPVTAFYSLVDHPLYALFSSLEEGKVADMALH